MAAALPLLERRLRAAPPPAAEHYAVCKAGCVALAKAAAAVSIVGVPWEVEQSVLITRTAPFLLAGWQRVAGALTSGAASAAEAALVLIDVFICLNLVAQFLGMLGTGGPARLSEWTPVMRSLAVQLVPWLAPAVNTLAGAAKEQGGWCGGSRKGHLLAKGGVLVQSTYPRVALTASCRNAHHSVTLNTAAACISGRMAFLRPCMRGGNPPPPSCTTAGDMMLLHTTCKNVRSFLQAAGHFSTELDVQLQASPVARRQLAEALDRCALLAVAAAFNETQPSDGGGRSGGPSGAASSAAAARPVLTPDRALIAALEARWSPALLDPPALSGGAHAPPANAPALLDLANQLLAAAPAELPPAGASRSTYLRAVLAICCFTGEAGSRCSGPHRALGVSNPTALQPVAQAAVRLLPRLAAAWRLMLGSAARSELSAGMAAVGQSVATALNLEAGRLHAALASIGSCCLLATSLTGFATAQRLAHWCAAADAALRLVPDLLQLASTEGEEVAPFVILPFLVFQQTAHLTASALGARSLHLGCGGCSDCAPPAQREPLKLSAAQCRSLQVLHSTACRAVHMLFTQQWGSLAMPTELCAMATQPHAMVGAAFNVLLAAKAAAAAQGQPAGQEPPMHG